jgi:hypothetical protein
MEIERFLGYEVTKNPLPEGIGEGPEYVPMIKKGRRGGKPNHKHQRGAKGKGGNQRKGRYRGGKKGKNDRNAPKGDSK